MESLAAAYGWTPAAMDELDLDAFESWGELASARLKVRAQPVCAWMSHG